MIGAASMLLLATVAQPTLELPWPCGVGLYCTQGHGGFSHNGTGYWAWDFDVDEGEEVWAAAGGTVEHVRMSGSTGCCDPSCGWDANYVVINHGDGTEALYLHLQYGSSPLSVGQGVETGDFVGRVGLTGYVCGDHLHFAVQQDCGSYYCTTIPGTFYDYGDPGAWDWLVSGNCPTPDSDGDGWNDDEDCDDGNAGIHPGATEICDDGIDQDCNGADLASQTYYYDDDGDGYGDEAVVACGSQPGGTVSVSGDCDDGDPAIHPGAEELCDAKDNDCNGEVDDGNPTVMGVPPPAYAATLIDASYPATLEPGQTADLWVAFENLGSETWERGAVLLVFAPAADAETSQLYAEESWPAWDVLGLVDGDVEPGETALFEGRIVAPQDPGIDVVERFNLVASDGTAVLCPEPEIVLDVTVGSLGGDLPENGKRELADTAGGCACAGEGTGRKATPLVALLVGAAALLRRARPG